MDMQRMKMESDASLKLQMHQMTLESNAQIEMMRAHAASQPQTAVNLDTNGAFSQVGEVLSQAIVAMQASQAETQQMIVQAFAQLAQVMGAPRETKLIRDSAGRAAGSIEVISANPNE